MDWTSEYLGGRLGLNQPVNTSLKPGQEKWVVVSSWCFAFGTSGGPSGARRTLWSCGSVPSACELCSLINYALAANEIERVELPLQLSMSDGERSLCPGTGSTPGLGRDAALTQARCGLSEWVGCGKSGTLFCKSQALQYRPACNDLPKYLPDSTFQMQSIKSVELPSWPLN